MTIFIFSRSETIKSISSIKCFNFSGKASLKSKLCNRSVRQKQTQQQFRCLRCAVFNVVPILLTPIDKFYRNFVAESSAKVGMRRQLAQPICSLRSRRSLYKQQFVLGSYEQRSLSQHLFFIFPRIKSLTEIIACYDTIWR